MIDFEIPTLIQRQTQLLTVMAEQTMRPVARYYDEHEGERPWEYINLVWQSIRAQGGRTLTAPKDDPGPRFHNLMLMYTIEAMAWGDAGLYLSTPGAALGGAAVEATGTPEQVARNSQSHTGKFLARALNSNGARDRASQNK